MKQRFLASVAVCAAVLAGLLAATTSPAALAQSFPAQPVRLISPFPAGSGPDVVARIVGERLSAAWKQPVVVDARPGANGFLAAGAVKQAAPTGYDLLLADVGHLAISPALFKNLPYNPKTDFVPVGGIYRTSFFIAVGANSPIRTVKDLIAAASANPGKITYGSNSVGGPLHLGAAQVEAVTGTKMLHVPYKEISQLYLAVSTGEVDWAMGSVASTSALVKAGKLRLIAVADSARSTVLPDVPTFQEAGGPKDIQVRSWVAVMAPKGTPSAVVNTLNRSLGDVLKQPEVIEKFAGFGFLPDAQTPAALVRLIGTETVYYADMVKRTGATID
ncbi:MAG: tripartite tricarboxylate transporter substrate binding protein [Polaromonas sp.]|uniref:Bug family tripartite tricarboxylate transporter substrate binding protein n=1 Tax=Polaromonas sp. TaxID=1869339 RepID=UPI0025EDB055|nr:tripartite tricarboxylate transporter substrate binding protein [Polaromonas sp.]MBI2728371.1 tripartite tricarboxylate transporter substrate binding protein [Polaromonas sp.]